MLFASRILPLSNVKRFPQGFIAEVIGKRRIDFQRIGFIPVRAPDNMGQLFKRQDFLLSPLGIDLLLLLDTVPAQNIPDCPAAQSTLRQSVGIMGRNSAA